MIKSSLLLVLLSIAASSVLYADTHNMYEATYEMEKDSTSVHIGDALPAMEWVTSSGKVMHESDLPADHPVLVVLFNPMCDHCQHAASMLWGELPVQKDLTIVFLTGLNLKEYMNDFMKAADVKEQPRFMIGATDAAASKTMFLSKGIPQFMLYDKHHKLRLIRFEKMDMNELHKTLKQS